MTTGLFTDSGRLRRVFQDPFSTAGPVNYPPHPPARRIWAAAAPDSALHYPTLGCVLRLALRLPKFESLPTSSLI
jgi:hypothetical protein